MPNLDILKWQDWVKIHCMLKIFFFKKKTLHAEENIPYVNVVGPPTRSQQVFLIYPCHPTRSPFFLEVPMVCMSTLSCSPLQQRMNPIHKILNALITGYIFLGFYKSNGIMWRNRLELHDICNFLAHSSLICVIKWK